VKPFYFTPMAEVTLARNAMATRFEIVLNGDDPVALRAAGEEALDEIERLEAQLSLFRPSSEIAHLNARAAREPVRVTPAVFDLIEHARRLTAETGGAFDITVAPLVRCWGFMGGTGRQPSPDELADARQKVGMHLVICDPVERTVSFARQGVMLDLGAIGKGYAIERAAELLREAGVTGALLHGGTSTVYGLGSPSEGGSWQVAIEDPLPQQLLGDKKPIEIDVPSGMLNRAGGPKQPGGPNPGSQLCFARVDLRDEALSVSAVWGKFFEDGGRMLGHVLDPRSGRPVSTALLAAVILPSATETDALSTALLTLGSEGHDTIANLRPQMRTLVAAQSGAKLVIRSRGIGTEQAENLKA
jgi:FAD:protein FMN transferase